MSDLPINETLTKMDGSYVTRRSFRALDRVEHSSDPFRWATGADLAKLLTSLRLLSSDWTVFEGGRKK